jgi:hypothetical protein
MQRYLVAFESSRDLLAQTTNLESYQHLCVVFHPKLNVYIIGGTILKHKNGTNIKKD